MIALRAGAHGSFFVPTHPPPEFVFGGSPPQPPGRDALRGRVGNCSRHVVESCWSSRTAKPVRYRRSVMVMRLAVALAGVACRCGRCEGVSCWFRGGVDCSEAELFADEGDEQRRIQLGKRIDEGAAEGGVVFEEAAQVGPGRVVASEGFEQVAEFDCALRRIEGEGALQTLARREGVRGRWRWAGLGGRGSCISRNAF